MTVSYRKMLPRYRQILRQGFSDYGMIEEPHALLVIVTKHGPITCIYLPQPATSYELHPNVNTATCRTVVPAAPYHLPGTY